jgi:hypothetical protein
MSVQFPETTRKADINFNASGDNTIIAAAPAGKRIRIDHINFMPAAATNIQLKDGATPYGGAYPMLASTLAFMENTTLDQHGLIELSDGQAFVMNSSVATQVSGFVKYRLLNE